jgi:hypothetical protein
MADDRQVYSNAQVGEALGVSDGTIRTWKRREAQQLIENVHWVTQKNQTFWTSQGIEALKQIQTTVAAKSFETDLETDETETVSNPFQRYTPLADAYASAITPQILQLIDRGVLQRVKQAIAQPMSPAECIAVLEDLGISPANPLTLIQDSGIAGLLSETDETGD